MKSHTFGSALRLDTGMSEIPECSYIACKIAGIDDVDTMLSIQKSGALVRPRGSSEFDLYSYRVKGIAGQVSSLNAYRTSGLESVDEWISVARQGLSASVVMIYQEYGVFDLEDMLALHSVGVSPTQYGSFLLAGIKDIEDIIWYWTNGVDGYSADQYRKSNFSRDEIKKLKSAGISSYDACSFLTPGVRDIDEIIQYSLMGINGKALNRLRMIGVTDKDEIEKFSKTFSKFRVNAGDTLYEALAYSITDKNAILNIINAGMTIPSARERLDTIGWDKSINYETLRSITESVPRCSARIRSGGRLIKIEVDGWDLRVGDESVSRLMDAERVMSALGARSRLVEVYNSWMNAIYADKPRTIGIPKTLHPSINKARLAYVVAAWLGEVPAINVS